MSNNILDSEKSVKKIKGSVIRYILLGLIYVLGVALGVACYWSKSQLNVSFNEIINTIFGSLEGSGDSVILEALGFCLPIAGVLLSIAVAILIYDRILVNRILILYDDKQFDKEEDETSYIDKLCRRLKRVRITGTVYCIGAFFVAVFYGICSYNVIDYVSLKLEYATIYEDYYARPDSSRIIDRGNAKNLIYIYLESMETTYASKEEGGSQEVNYIPNLTKLANDNISFSNTEKLGGFYSNYGSTWTLGALYTSSSGVPYALPLEGNTPPEYDTFASGLITIGDVLYDKGYYNEFLCGSDANFAGRKLFYERHGNYNVYDYYTAIDDGVIPEDYLVWWGLEDQKLYEIAKSELTELSQKEQPFNFTMLTADTHFPEGYICELCDSEYEVDAANVIACADRQLQNFIDWIKAQPFYEDTVIVISGDHPRMDTTLVEDKEWLERTVYNCIINSDVIPARTTINRKFESYDMFPTVLAAMGFDIIGDRLGLGVNMFSSLETLSEKFGVPYMEEELAKSSNFYLKEFAPEFLEEEQ